MTERKTTALPLVPRFITATLLFLCLGVGASRAQEAASASVQRPELQELATRILSRANEIGCASTCRIVVADFTLHEGATSVTGIQLADDLSADLNAERYPMQIVDRSVLRDFINRERISASILYHEKVLPWLATQLGVDAILIGTTTYKNDSVHLSVRLLSGEKRSREETMILPPKRYSLSELAPIEGYSEKPLATDGDSIPDLVRAGMDGSTMPRCMSKPDPLYNDEARRAKLTGKVVVTVVILLNNKVKVQHIVSGMPLGLNDQARQIFTRWRCVPSEKDGKPVPTLVPVEFTFKLY